MSGVNDTQPAAEPGADLDDQFALWVAEHGPLMRILANREVGAADADDLVQEAFLRAWQRRDTFDPARGTVKAWLVTLLFSQARAMRIRHRRHGRDHPLVPVISAASDNDALVDLDRAVQALPRRQRQVISLYYLADMSVEDTAALLGISVGTTKSHLYDARGALRARLGEES